MKKLVLAVALAFAAAIGGAVAVAAVTSTHVAACTGYNCWTGNLPMKNFVLALMLALAVLGGAVAVSAVTVNSTYADPNGDGSGGH